MAKRRTRRNNSIASVVPDVVRIASGLPWWGALLMGTIAYLAISVALGGYIESIIVKQQGSQFAAITEIRLGYMVRTCTWVGIACFLAGAFFAMRNAIFSKGSSREENWLVSVISKIVGRSLD